MQSCNGVQFATSTYCIMIRFETHSTGVKNIKGNNKILQKRR